MAGETLSGCPSISLAIVKISCLSMGVSVSKYAPYIPATTQVELLPKPRLIGTSLSIDILTPEISLFNFLSVVSKVW